ncbi:MAG: transglycosylase SLT domain-containing protein [Paracoccaceae bacterium]
MRCAGRPTGAAVLTDAGRQEGRRAGRTRRRHFSILAALYLFLGFPPPSSASGDESDLCDRAANLASAETGVPVEVLRAISLTETGHRREGSIRPWPWTVNMEGNGVWFDTPDEARAFVDAEYRRGARSFDVGCFQINYKWHGQGFASIDQMFEPEANARYAANFMRRLHAELGDWSAAAGAYHSRTPFYADRYRTRFERFLARLTGAAPVRTEAPAVAAPGIPEIPDIVAALGGDPATGARPPVPRVNRYPLLRSAGPAAPALGSLVPIGAAAGPALFAGTGEAAVPVPAGDL